ncbi:hypothetical protein V1514DRAFT_324834 [Lipomyces japonicus]|uniref:uncharacterized protein n=1 Tax=Lipomyces japonicus TaxID=56871 RepID=UPI0034CED6BB
MPSIDNKQIIFNSLPHGVPTKENLKLVTSKIDTEPPKGGILIEILYFSLDPYLRGKLRSSDAKSYSAAFELGKPLSNFGIAKVKASATDAFNVDDILRTDIAEFSQFQAVHADKLTHFAKIDNPYNFPLTYFIGVLGMPGLTAYYSLYTIGGPLKKNETILVSAAAGAVGQLVGQLAKHEGLRVVGSVGSDEKAQYLKEKLKFDDAWNYKTEKDLDAAIKAHIPEGIDIYYENVGGEILDAVLANANNFARIVASGSISQYNLKPEEQYRHKNLAYITTKRIKLQGFIILDVLLTRPDIVQEFTEKVSEFLHKGEIVYKEEVYDGIESTYDAFVGLLSGKNFGKSVVKVSK